ncbi:ribosomal protein L22 [Peniophora sp. CONT]|nr:ribosomal protein L22 [Peniophora sp. CONT]
MQSVARVGLRNASSLRCRASPAFASSSRVFVEARRQYAAGPLGWIGEAFSPNVRKKQSEEEKEAARRKQAQKGTGGLLDPALVEPVKKSKAPAVAKSATDAKAAKKAKEGPSDGSHKYSTTNFKHSHRKLNKLGNQIAGKPIDLAIVQMQFSEKRNSKRIKSMLATAKQHATMKGLDPERLLVSEAWVNKGPILSRYRRYRSRSRWSIGKRPAARMHVVLKEGKTREELIKELRERRLSKIASAGYVREDVPLRNPPPMWAW